MQSNARAFQQLYDLHKGRVFAFAFALTKSRDLAEEIVQVVFIKLWEHRERINTSLSFHAYLRKITYHHVVSYFRKLKLDISLQQELLHNIQSMSAPNEEQLAGKQLNQIYRQAIEHLPTQKKKLYLLSREENLSYEEIANEVGLSKNTVRNHMADAIRFIRQYVTSHSDLASIILAILIRRTL